MGRDNEDRDDESDGEARLMGQDNEDRDDESDGEARLMGRDNEDRDDESDGEADPNNVELCHWKRQNGVP